MHQAGPLTLEGIAANLRALGADVGLVKKVEHMDDIARSLPRDGSVAIVGILGDFQGQRVGHAVYVFKDLSGSTRVMDRTGVYKSLSDLNLIYGVKQFSPFAYVHVKNVFGKVMVPGGTAVLAMEVLGVIATQQGATR
ncbi:hypothetical protein [Pseudomonas mangiferae]|uniref:Uncharacterized protein n=1 Tax=Pseudomonas mangiferae TaxID=2593654 RepID=A0A553GYI3_9PSED|nr:hypothetical protein [Pseudomonas mangiferae]TRX74535.1 hypothetical protein FM069_11030 [Pseudomonas mangiferae]